ncbi:MAG: uroporphyrinogen-III synthase [Acidobacteria bacterium]|nr:uroporphyrinogen-III synthase [Acidobacteriota bacterium]MBI3656447.1 uroporphyrinogen-III synthase [Acidobacteriota bacterium]
MSGATFLPPRGRLCLVDLGPGDTGLWTVRARAYLEQADCLLIDEPVPIEIAACLPAGAHVAIIPTLAHLLEDAVHRNQLTDWLGSGKVVVRLRLSRRGFPGALFEEAQCLNTLGIAYEIVPGLSLMETAPLYAGVSPTSPDVRQTFRCLVGGPGRDHERWLQALRIAAETDETLVCLLDPPLVRELAESLLKMGKDPHTPVVVIRRGTLPEQRTQLTILNDLHDFGGQEESYSNWVVVVGEAARGRSEFNWFENKPLFGQRVLVTRARQQAAELSVRLQAYGAAVLEAPTIEIVPPRADTSLDEALRHLDRYNWLLFTSVNGVESFFSRLLAGGADMRELKGKRIGAIGPATARAIARYYLRVDLMPEEYRAEAVIPALEQCLSGSHGWKDLSILLPRARVARDVLPDQLRQRGAHIDVVEAYQTVVPVASGTRIKQALAQRQITGAIFTSSSTVSNLAALLEADDLSVQLSGIWVACIGPITSATAKKFNLVTDIMPNDYTVPALVEAIVHAAANWKRSGDPRGAAPADSS